MAAPPANETVSIRRISWAEFYKIRPDREPKADNDNKADKEKAA